MAGYSCSDQRSWQGLSLCLVLDSWDILGTSGSLLGLQKGVFQEQGLPAHQTPPTSCSVLRVCREAGEHMLSLAILSDLSVDLNLDSELRLGSPQECKDGLRGRGGEKTPSISPAP